MILQRAVASRQLRRRSSGRMAMIVGAVSCIGGVAATVATYVTAVQHDGYYFVFWAAVAYGVCQFLWGLIRFRTA